MEKEGKKEHKAVKESTMFKMTGMRFQLLFYNIIPLMLVELLYILLSVCIIAPLFRFLFNAIIAVSGTGSLTSENMLEFLLNPLTLLCTCALIVCIGIYSLLDISAAIFTFDCSRCHRQVGVIEIVEFSFKNAIRTLLPKNIFLLVVVLVFLPIMSFGVSSSFLSVASVPSTLTSYIRSNVVLSIAASISIVLMLIVTLRWIFSVHYFTLEQVDFITAAKKSARLDRKHRILNLLSMLVVQAALALCNLVLIFVGKYAMIALIGLTGAQTLLGAFLIAIVFVAFGFAIVVINSLGMPLSVLKISARYYYLKESAGEEIAPISYTHRTPRKIIKYAGRIFIGAMLAIAILLFTLIFLSIAKGNDEVTNALHKDADVTACLGGSSNVSPQTLANIEDASKHGAAKVSVNVQVSQDGIVFLSSTSYASPSGQFPSDVWTLDYDAIANNQSETSESSSSDSNKRYPLLSRAIKTAKDNDIGIIIDVSAIGYCSDGIERVVDLVSQSDYADGCEIASRTYNDLERTKNADANLSTVYIAGIAFGSFDTYDAADAIALESVSVSEENISSIHSQGKSAYGWDMESSEAMADAAAYDIDNIVTSPAYVSTAIKAVETLGLSDFSLTVISQIQQRNANADST